MSATDGAKRPGEGRSLSNATLALMSILLLCGLGTLAAPRIKSFFWPIVAFDCPAPGTVFTLRVTAPQTGPVTNRMIMTGRDGSVCGAHSDVSGDYGWIGGLVPDNDSWEKVDRYLTPQLWPMRVGNRREYYHEWPDGRWASAGYVVADYGWLRVPAGLFRVFRVVQTRATRDWKGVTTRWWSPELKGIVKQESNDHVNDWELIEVAVPPAD